MLARVTDVIKHLVVYPGQHEAQSGTHGGLVYSQRLLLALIEKGAQRKESYEAVQRNAMASWNGSGGLQELVSKDPFVHEASQARAKLRPVLIRSTICGILTRFFGEYSDVVTRPNQERGNV